MRGAHGRVVLGGVLPLGLLVAAAMALPATAAAAWGPGAKLTLPSDAAANPNVRVVSISCASAGNCSAVGSYIGGAGQRLPMVVNEVSRSWGAAQKVTLPSDAGTSHDAELSSVSCSSAGACSAVGYYGDDSNLQQAMVVDEASGSWGAAQKLTLPADADGGNPGASLTTVSCASPGSCSAVGGYEGAGVTQAMVVDEASGTWGAAQNVALPGDASATHPLPALNSVSCAAAGECGAVGHYTDNANHKQALTVDETSGTWGAGRELTPPAGAATNPLADLASVSCGATGTCLAVGAYTDSAAGHQALVATESSGAWGAGQNVTLPADAATDPNASLASVSCAAASDCSAVGTYTDGSGWKPMAVNDVAGSIGGAQKLTLPAGADAQPFTVLTSVSCSSAGNCGAVGSYGSSGHDQAMVVDQASGNWAAAQKVTVPADAASQVAHPDSVSCAAPGYCSAAGTYAATSSHAQGLLIESDPTAPSVTLSSPAAGSSTNDASPQFAGTAGTADGDAASVTVELWPGAAVGAGAPAYTASATRDASTGAYSTSGPFTRVSDSSTGATLPDGTWTAMAVQSDSVSNTGRSQSTTFRVDATLPTSHASAPATSTSSKVRVRYTADGTGSALDRVELYVKAPGAGSYSKAATDTSHSAAGQFDYVAPARQGRYSFYTRAYDTFGNAEAAPASADASTALRSKVTINHHVTRTNARRTRVGLNCTAPAGTLCKGKLWLEPIGRGKSSGKPARVSFSLKPGAHKKYSLVLPPRTRTQLAKSHRAGVRAVARLSDGQKATRLLTVVRGG
jgi:hypothetical protein